MDFALSNNSERYRRLPRGSSIKTITSHDSGVFNTSVDSIPMSPLSINEEFHREIQGSLFNKTVKPHHEHTSEEPTKEIIGSLEIKEHKHPELFEHEEHHVKFSEPHDDIMGSIETKLGSSSSLHHYNAEKIYEATDHDIQGSLEETKKKVHEHEHHKKIRMSGEIQGSLHGRKQKAKKDKLQIRTNSLFCACAVMLQMMQHSLLFNNLWPYLKSIDAQVSQTEFGALISTYYFATFLSATIFVNFATKAKTVAIFLSLANVAGNIFYLLASNSGPYYFTIAIISQIFLGISCGCIALLRNHCLAQNSPTNRSRLMVILTVATGTGAVFGSVLQPTFVAFDKFQINIISIVLNYLTAPIFTLIIFNLLFAAVSLCLMQSKDVNLAHDDEEQNEDQIYNPDYAATVVVNCVRLIVCAISTFIETIVPILTLMTISTERIFYNALVYAITGCVFILISAGLTGSNLVKRLGPQHVTFLCLTSALVVFLLFRPFLVRINSATEPFCAEGQFQWCKKITASNYLAAYALFVLLIGALGPALNISTSLWHLEVSAQNR